MLCYKELVLPVSGETVGEHVKVESEIDDFKRCETGELQTVHTVNPHEVQKHLDVIGTKVRSMTVDAAISTTCTIERRRWRRG